MYAYFIGKITYIDNEQVILENNGIGYNIKMPTSDIMTLDINEEVKIYTYTSVREDAFLLYGFLSFEELNFYKLLLTVNGVGPKAAMSILSASTIDNLQVAIIAQDAKMISKLPGIGPKTAARIILDLKDKVKPQDIIEASIGNANEDKADNKYNDIKKEACEILGALGYSPSEAMRAVNKVVVDENKQATDVVSEALRLM